MKARITLFLVWFLLFLPDNPNAQLRGRVIDTSGNPLADAVVTFTSPTDTTLSFSGVTDDNGDYHIYYNLASSQKPSAVVLEQNYPNPFNPSTTINFFLPENGFSEIVVYNVLGHKIRTLANREYSYGQHQVVWDGKDENGRGVSAGVYIYQLRSAGIVETKKMLMVDGSGAGAFSAGPAFKQSSPEMIFDATVTSDLIIPFTKTVTFTDNNVDLIVSRKNIAISIKKNHTLALKNDGTVWAWGNNSNGQLGDGTTINRTRPVQVSGLTDIVAIDAGGNHSVALKKDGTVWTWGLNNYGQLGDDTTSDKLSPIKVNIENISAVSAGYSYTLSLKKDTVWAWGGNSLGQLGDGTKVERHSPVQVYGMTDVIKINAGGAHGLAMKKDGTLWGWGKNWFLPLGPKQVEFFDERIFPVQIESVDNIKKIYGGYDHTIALKKDGTVWIWGYHLLQVDPSKKYLATSTPQHVPGLTNIQDIATGYYQQLAVDKDRKVYTWGQGYLGDGNGESGSPAPIELTGLTDIVGIACGLCYSVCLKADGSLWAWGVNGSGQLGDGTTTDRLTPIRVPDF